MYKKYKQDIESLIKKGQELELSLTLWSGKHTLKPEQVTEAKKKVADFRTDYQSWYSEASSLIKTMLPDRYLDFTKLYERPKTTRKDLNPGNYVIEDALYGLEVQQLSGFESKKVVSLDAAIPRLQQQIAIVKACERRFETVLFDIKVLLQADLFDSELHSALELNSKGFMRAAGAVAGVVLEGHLSQVCDNHNLKLTKKDPTINDLNDSLKNNNIIDIAVFRRIQFLGDVRNKCDHKKTEEPKKEEVSDLISGVEYIIKNVF